MCGRSGGSIYNLSMHTAWAMRNRMKCWEGYASGGEDGRGGEMSCTCNDGRIHASARSSIWCGAATVLKCTMMEPSHFLEARPLELLAPRADNPERCRACREPKLHCGKSRALSPCPHLDQQRVFRVSVGVEHMLFPGRVEMLTSFSRCLLYLSLCQALQLRKD